MGPISAAGFGIACTSCGDTVIAPHWSQFVCKNEVRHFWACESCGQEFDTTVKLAGKAAAGRPERAHDRDVCRGRLI